MRVHSCWLMQCFFTLSDCISKISREEGVAQLWSGTQASLLLVSNPAIQFMVYEGMKRQLQHLYGAEVNIPLTCTYLHKLGLTCTYLHWHDD